VPTIRCHREIAAPQAEVFALTQDYDVRTRWDPFHRDYRKLDGETAVGARIWYRASNRMTMTVRYVSYDPPERVAMTMIEGPWMFSRFSGSWVFKPLSSERCSVTFAYSFELRALFRLLDGVVTRRLERTMAARLAGLAAIFVGENDQPHGGGAGTSTTRSCRPPWRSYRRSGRRVTTDDRGYQFHRDHR